LICARLSSDLTRPDREGTAHQVADVRVELVEFRAVRGVLLANLLEVLEDLIQFGVGLMLPRVQLYDAALVGQILSFTEEQTG
jgi:hypothetical protein